MSTEFPHFKKIELTDKEIVERITKSYLPYSDFNFVSMYGYNTENLLEFSILNNNLIVMFTDYITNEPFYSFFGENKPLETSITLLSEARKKNILPYLKLIPEIDITEDLLASPILNITEDRDNFDYILSIEDIANMSNKHYNKKKQYVSFENEYPQRQLSELDLQDKTIQKQIMYVFHQWRIDKGKSEEETATELIAITRTLEHAKLLQAYGVGIFWKNEMIGFTIADLGHNGYAEFHFVKASPMYKGIFAALYIYLAQHLYKKGFKYMNIEQDLGISGLRNAKEQWHPIKFLKKYIVKSTASD